MAKSKIDFRHILIEAILIVFTVLLALALSEWRDSIQEEKTKEAILRNIISEIENNKADLESKKDYHQEVSQKLRDYLNSDSLWSSLNVDLGIGGLVQILNKGLQNPNLQSGAWRSAELSGIVNSFDYETIYTLSNLYRVQENGVESTWKSMASFFIQPESYDPENQKRIALMLQLGFQELYSQENFLIYTYSQALESLQEKR